MDERLLLEAIGHVQGAIVGGVERVEAAVDRLTGAIEAATAPPAVDVQVEEEKPEPFWAYVQLFGQRTMYGLAEEVEFLGARMLQVRCLRRAKREPGVGEPTPPVELEPIEEATRYGRNALYAVTTLTQAQARRRYLRSIGIYADPDEEDEDIPF